MASFDVGLASGARVTAIPYPAAGERIGTLVLGHGAGASQSHPWMVGMARGLAERGLDITTFNFPYMEEKRRIPDVAAALEACFRAVVAAVRTGGAGDAKLFLGGKSMGGRMATHLAAARDPNLAGLVLLGYPLHPPGKPQQLRVKHLPQVEVPMLFVQGTRDTLGTPYELCPVLATLRAKTELFVVEKGEHSFTVPKRGAPPDAQTKVLAMVMDRVARFVREVSASSGRTLP